jgi:hypothetical protein
MLSRVALVKAEVSEGFSASIIRVTRIGELRTMLAVTINQQEPHVVISQKTPLFLLGFVHIFQNRCKY